jgi:hypothetical protein
MKPPHSQRAACTRTRGVVLPAGLATQRRRNTTTRHRPRNGSAAPNNIQGCARAHRGGVGRTRVELSCTSFREPVASSTPRLPVFLCCVMWCGCGRGGSGGGGWPGGGARAWSGRSSSRLITWAAGAPIMQPPSRGGLCAWSTQTEGGDARAPIHTRAHAHTHARAHIAVGCAGGGAARALQPSVARTSLLVVWMLSGCRRACVRSSSSSSSSSSRSSSSSSSGSVSDAVTHAAHTRASQRVVHMLHWAVGPAAAHGMCGPPRCVLPRAMLHTCQELAARAASWMIEGALEHLVDRPAHWPSSDCECWVALPSGCWVHWAL